MTESVHFESAGEPWSAAPSGTIIELVVEACRRDPDRPLLIFEDGLTMNRRELLDRIERFGGYLQGRIQPGDRVAIILNNRAEFMIAWLALALPKATPFFPIRRSRNTMPTNPHGFA